MEEHVVGPNPIDQDEGEAAVADLYDAFGIADRHNVAYVEVHIGDVREELTAASGHRPYAGTVSFPIARLFATYDDPKSYLRDSDAEVKLLEEVARLLEPDAEPDGCYPRHRGEIRLYSHFTICPSCLGVIAAFGEMFPNVDISYSDGPI